jgi:hypothetical protein
LVGADGPVGQCQPAALAPTDHGLDDVAEKPTCQSAVSQFAAPLKVLPGDLERILEELGERDGHEQKTNENLLRSMPTPLRRPLSFIDRKRLGPNDHLAEPVGRRRVQGIADRKARIPPIASGCDLPSLLLGVSCDSLACRLAFAQASGTRGQATALAKANPCSVPSARNHRTDGFVQAGVISMLMTKERLPAIRTLSGWAISVLQDAGAILECEDHGWMRDRADPHARGRAFAIAHEEPLPGVSSEAAAVAVAGVLDGIGDACPKCEITDSDPPSPAACRRR